MSHSKSPYRVVITGYGAVTPLGDSAAESWQAIMDYRRGYRYVDLSANGIHTHFIGQVANEPSLKGVPAAIRRRLPRHARLALAAAREAVAMCKAQGLKIGLASASPLRMLEKVLTMFELRDQFDALASAEGLPFSKPHPQVYLDCAARLGVSPMHCVALEDSVNGMIASKAARMRSIVVPEAENSRDPRFVLADVKLATLESLTLSDLLG